MSEWIITVEGELPVSIQADIWEDANRQALALAAGAPVTLKLVDPLAQARAAGIAALMAGQPLTEEQAIAIAGSGPSPILPE